MSSILKFKGATGNARTRTLAENFRSGAPHKKPLYTPEEEYGVTYEEISLAYVGVV